MDIVQLFDDGTLCVYDSANHFVNDPEVDDDDRQPALKRVRAAIDAEIRRFCDRCNSTDDVRVIDWCQECGPTPLCAQCEQWHREDLALEG